MHWQSQKLENFPGYREAMAKASWFIVLALVILTLIDLFNNNWDRLSLDAGAALAFSVIAWRRCRNSKERSTILRQASRPPSSVWPNEI
jgi:hypothetical protein